MALCSACRKWLATALETGRFSELDKSLSELSTTDLDELLILANKTPGKDSTDTLKPVAGVIFTKADFQMPRELADIWRARDTCWVCSWLGLAYDIEHCSHPSEPQRHPSDGNSLPRIDVDFRVELHLLSTEVAQSRGYRVVIHVTFGTGYDYVILSSSLDNNGVWQPMLDRDHWYPDADNEPRNRPVFKYSLSRATTGESILLPVDESAVHSASPVEFEESAPSSTCADLLPPHRVSKIQSWLKTCTQEHEGCDPEPHLLGAQSFLPTRLIFIDEEPNKPRLLETRSLPAGEIVRYATLSHCWGGKQPLTLTDQNYPELLKAVPVEKLQRTFLEAIEVCRNLDIRYLWIDCLCIIQHSVGHTDWHKEASRMHHVYGRSLLNLSATSSANGDGGLLRRCESALLDTIQITLPCGAVLGEYFWHNARSRLKSLVDSPLLRRGWVLQELFLAPRVLHFLAGQLAWQCKQSAHFEIDEHAFGAQAISKKSNLSMYRFFFSRTVSAAGSIQELDLLWVKVSEGYSSTLVTKPDDRYYALAGLVTLFAARYAELGVATTYAAGLWTHNIIGTLPWRRIHDVRSFPEPPSYPVPASYKPPDAPSWSPLKSHNVDYHPKMYQLRELATCEMMEVDRINADNLAGPVKHGHIHLQAPFLDIDEVKAKGCDLNTFRLVPEKDKPAVLLPFKMRFVLWFDDDAEELFQRYPPGGWLHCSCILLHSEIRPGTKQWELPSAITAFGLVVKETQRLKDGCMCYVRIGTFAISIQVDEQEDDIELIFKACDAAKTPLWLI